MHDDRDDFIDQDDAIDHDDEAQDAEDAFAERRTAALGVLQSAIEANSILIYKPEDLRRAILELEGEEDDDDYVSPEDERPREKNQNLTSESANRLHHLRRITRGPLGPRRRLIVGSERMLERVEAVTIEAPHFARFVDLVARSVSLSMITRTPLRLPPILLVGAPGIGKTFVLKKIAAALDSPVELFPMNMLDTFRLRGLNTAWKGARTGRIAEALLKSATASPIIVLDEFEKAPRLGRFDRPYDVFHTLLEEENAEDFVDDFLELPLRADRIIWIGSANGTADLPASILDRMLVLEIPAPDRDQLARIVEGIYATVRAPYDDHFAANPERRGQGSPRQTQSAAAEAHRRSRARLRGRGRKGRARDRGCEPSCCSRERSHARRHVPTPGRLLRPDLIAAPSANDKDIS